KLGLRSGQSKSKSFRMNAAGRKLSFAVKALSTIRGEWRDNTVPFLEIRHCGTRFFDDAGEFMAEDNAEGSTGITSGQDMQIRSTNSGGCYPNNCVIGLVDFRLGTVLQRRDSDLF